MANSKISALSSAATVVGTEVLPIVQSSATVKVSVANLTPGLSTITAAKGGTGQTSYAVGDLIYADTTTTLAKLADVATGNALISGGVGVAPSYGKIGLTTHVSGTLPVANGGTNLTSFTANGIVYASSTSALATGSALGFNGTNLLLGSSANLLVNRTSTSFAGQYSADFAGTTRRGATYNNTDANSGANFLTFASSGTSIGTVSQNGTTGVLYNITSDYRLKNNRQPLTGAKDFIMALQPKKWQWWDGSGEGVGFIAHEFMEVAKYSGNGKKDAIDADGNPLMQSIQPSSSEVIANIVSFIQEQQTLIFQLQADVAALKNKL
jgi:hypothetical protein